MFRASGIFLLWLACSCLGATPPPSPCPDVFSYHYDNSRGWYGVVTILPPASFSMVQFVFKMTVADYTLNRGYGRIEVLGGNAEVQEISKRAYQGVRERIQFVINFPPVNNIPRVKEVIINNVTFCSDRRDYGRGASITLDYSIKTGLNVPDVSGNHFSILPSSQHQIPHPSTNENCWPPDKAHPTTPSFGSNGDGGGGHEYHPFGGNDNGDGDFVWPTLPETQRPHVSHGDNNVFARPALSEVQRPQSPHGDKDHNNGFARPATQHPLSSQGHNSGGSFAVSTPTSEEPSPDPDEKKHVIVRVQTGSGEAVKRIIVELEDRHSTKNVTANFKKLKP